MYQDLASPLVLSPAYTMSREADGWPSDGEVMMVVWQQGKTIVERLRVVCFGWRRCEVVVMVLWMCGGERQVKVLMTMKKSRSEGCVMVARWGAPEELGGAVEESDKEDRMLANNLKVLPMLNAPDQTSDPRKGGDCQTIVERVAWWCASVGGDGEGGCDGVGGCGGCSGGAVVVVVVMVMRMAAGSDDSEGVDDDDDDMMMRVMLWWAAVGR
ncbi:hypothetical protein Tco_1135321 [Tanacetum coccineum]